MRERVRWVIVIGCLLVAFAVFVYLGYQDPGFKWTGFKGKSLFAWLQILVSASIPVAIGLGIFYLTRAAKARDDAHEEKRKETEQALETRREEEAALQAYLDYISRMLTDPDRALHRSRMGDNLSVVARAQTLTVLGRLEDGARKGSAIKFLPEANLIRGNYYPVINLSGADLGGAVLGSAALDRAFLQEANLQEAGLQGADLQGADLYRAKLHRASLHRADLYRAILKGADLYGAILKGASLVHADLQGANLHSASLHSAKLQGAEGLTQDQIEQAIGDDDTILSEGIDHPKWWSDRSEGPTEEDK